MSAPGLYLLQRLLRDDRSLRRLRDLGVTHDVLDSQSRKAFEAITEHFSKYRTLPSTEVVEAEAGIKFPVNPPDEPLEYWADRTKDYYLALTVKDGLSAIAEQLKSGDLSEALARLSAVHADVVGHRISRNLMPFGALADRVMEAHGLRQRRGQLMGVPFGFPFLDEISDGAQAGDLIVLVGRPSAGKSYFLLFMLLSAFRANKRTLFVSQEMPLVQCARRLVALATGVSPTDLRLGRVSSFRQQLMVDQLGELSSPREVTRRRRVMRNGEVVVEEETTTITPTPPVFLKAGFTDTIDDVLVQAAEVRPDVLYVDGPYLLQVANKRSSSYERQSTIAEKLKAFAQNQEIPVIVTYQLNRQGEGSRGGLSNIYMSDIIGQLASIAMKVTEDDTQEDTEGGVWDDVGRRVLRLLKGREGEQGGIVVEFDPARSIIQQVEVLSDES